MKHSVYQLLTSVRIHCKLVRILDYDSTSFAQSANTKGHYQKKMAAETFVGEKCANCYETE